MTTSNSAGKQGTQGLGAAGAPSTAIGGRAVRDWARTLPPGAPVIDVGCGSVLPITKALVEEGLNVYALDAAPSFVRAFRNNFPQIPVACEAVEDSSFFGRMFDGVVAWGLIFLLPVEAQRSLIQRVATILVPGGRCCSRRVLALNRSCGMMR